MRRRRRRRRRRRIILVGGLVALGAYKLSQKDVQRVEEQTGKKAEDLSDEELEQAMDDLNIDAEEMTDEEFDYVDAADAEEEDDGDDYIEQLERLAKLRDDGIITDEEFAAKKSGIVRTCKRATGKTYNVRWQPTNAQQLKRLQLKRIRQHDRRQDAHGSICLCAESGDQAGLGCAGHWRRDRHSRLVGL